MNKKLKVGILGGTGFVGQRLVTLLEHHPYFEIVVIGASKNSAGKTYYEAVKNRWKLNLPIPDNVKNIIVKDIYEIEEISSQVDLVFCAVNMPKDEIRKIEESYAKAEVPVISNNSANRWTPDVPVVIPEINDEHLKLIENQRKRLGTKRGFIVAKPNCSIQSYVPAINALMEFKPKKILVCTYQAISGSGKIFSDWPEINDNVIPFISGEEEKSEKEPLKVWGHIEDGKIVNAVEPTITSQCIRVPVSDGHLAAVFVSFENKPSKETILKLWKEYTGKPQLLNLPSAPKQFLTYFEEADRPQTKLDRDIENGMGISIGRLREDSLFDYKFVCLSHNTLRGAAGGSVLTAELLKEEGYLF
ncbi:Aspartate-semialdehyde dehydrogenase 2 [Clostridium liquoris]|jgi:aspartate-semialdehyde dehydrogenase|uniref:Aspartate-semialdehyde dehydrogenase 2 n=1 Tax=Clostridium liquoris TaxID=1289519 RepID=A0A2T0B2Y6_9CLOT|nr:aspartate-semialdehyde dehydrogenase [Clostridium liquoris]PRR78271.1 Aspartate-semialdehyde dehydrogenase 2 [Clostridium liquoris]